MPLGVEVGFGPGHIVLDGAPVLPYGKGHSSPPPQLFRPMSIAAKRSPISATAELLCNMILYEKGSPIPGPLSLLGTIFLKIFTF